MKENNWNLEKPPVLPEDLRSRVGEDRLLRLVFQALEAVEPETAAIDQKSLAPGRPRVLWTILTYAYATGLYSSEQIERQVEVDKGLLYLSARSFPSADELRRFRRAHRFFLECSLSQVLQLAWEGGIAPEESDRHLRLPFGTWNQRVAVFDCDANRRIQEAVLLDSMALDY